MKPARVLRVIRKAIGFRRVEGMKPGGKWVKGWVWATPAALRALRASFWTGAQVKVHTALTGD